MLAGYAGKAVGVMVRSAAEMARVVPDNPFPKAAPNRVIASFLDRAPSAEALAGIRGRADEEVRLGRREIYAHYPGGQGTSKLIIPATAAGTGRNNEHGRGPREDGRRALTYAAARFAACNPDNHDCLRSMKSASSAG